MKPLRSDRLDPSNARRQAMTARTITKALVGMWTGSYGLVRCPVHRRSQAILKIKDDPTQ